MLYYHIMLMASLHLHPVSLLQESRGDPGDELRNGHRHVESGVSIAPHT